MVEGGQGRVVAGGGMAKGQVMAGEVRGKSVAEQSVDECGREGKSRASRATTGKQAGKERVRGARSSEPPQKTPHFLFGFALSLLTNKSLDFVCQISKFGQFISFNGFPPQASLNLSLLLYFF